MESIACEAGEERVAGDSVGKGLGPPRPAPAAGDDEVGRAQPGGPAALGNDHGAPGIQPQTGRLQLPVDRTQRLRGDTVLDQTGR
nr:hypothetical protein [Streptomyces clavuligerus]